MSFGQVHIAAIVAGSIKICLIGIRHMPAPSGAGSVWYRWCFDVLQDAASNPDRVGERAAA